LAHPRHRIGPGLPPIVETRSSSFQATLESGTSHSAIASELVRGHGGTLTLVTRRLPSIDLPQQQMGGFSPHRRNDALVPGALILLCYGVSDGIDLRFLRLKHKRMNYRSFSGSPGSQKISERNRLHSSTGNSNGVSSILKKRETWVSAIAPGFALT
jgi:hypothetical protein